MRSICDPPSRLEYERELTEAVRRQAEYQRRHEQRQLADVRIDYSPVSQNHTVTVATERVMLSHALSLGEQQALMDRDGISIGQISRDISDRIVRQFAEEVERQLFENLTRMMRSNALRDYRPGRDYIGTPTLSPRVNDGDFRWTEKYPKEFKTEHCTAHLLDTEKKIVEEGKKMKHCLGTHYKQRSSDGRIAAFHIDVPKDICKSGLTMTFENTGDRWVYHACKGKANSEREDERIDAIRELIGNELNKEVLETTTTNQ